MNKIFWGCVENRNDNLKLGRYKVRVVGIHTDDKSLLPTDDLPWATCLQPTTSAAVSGIGQNPGLVNGSWVMVVFTSEDYQIPIILGSVAGIPSLTNIILSDGQSAPPAAEATPDQKKIGVEDGVYDPSVLASTATYLGTLTESQYNQFIAKSREIESTNNYSATNKLGYIGAYQFGAAALEDIGYIKAGSWSKFKKNSLLDDDKNWTGKNGCVSKKSFLLNKSAQDNCMLVYSQRAYKLMLNKNQINNNTDPRVLAGLLGAAHNQGTGCIAKLLRGETTVDGNGFTAKKYYDKCYSAITVTTLIPPATTVPPKEENEIPIPEEESTNPTNTIKNKNAGFLDPEGKYPAIFDESDINRLARGQAIDKTIVDIKEKERKKNVNIGLGGTWDQPSIQYAAQYPFNHAYVSESGHVMEFDDTPKAERVQLYHRTGTFVEIDQGGNQVNKIVGHGIEVIEQDGYVSIKGNGHISIEGSFTLHTPNAHLEISNLNIKTEKTIVHTESFEVKASKNFSVEAETISLVSSGNSIISTGGSFEASSGGKSSISASGTVALDGANIYLNSGKSTKTKPTAVPAVGMFGGKVMDISAVSRDESSAVVLDENPHARVIASDNIASAAPITKEKESEPVAPSTATPIETGDCSLFDLTLGMNIQLSPNYKLRHLCIGTSFNFNGQHGLSAQTLLCNLSKLCTNVIEPMRLKYGSSLKINDCFRMAGSPVSKSNGISQHEKGEAVDFGFKDIARGVSRKSGYYDRAISMQKIVPYDKFLFESLSKGDTVWIHVSYSRSQLRYKVMTLVDHNVRDDGKLVLYT